MIASTHPDGHYHDDCAACRETGENGVPIMIADTPRPLSRASQAFEAFVRRLALSPADESELRHHVTAWACTYANAARRGALLQIATQIAGEPTIREAVDLARRAAYAHEED